MAPHKVKREHLTKLTDLPNIGKAGAADLQLLGITHPHQLLNQCPYQMYETLCTITSTKHDPCVIDVFISITRFMGGDAPQAWWYYTPERKQRYTNNMNQ